MENLRRCILEIKKFIDFIRNILIEHILLLLKGELLR